MFLNRHLHKLILTINRIKTIFLKWVKNPGLRMIVIMGISVVLFLIGGRYFMKLKNPYDAAYLSYIEKGFKIDADAQIREDLKEGRAYQYHISCDERNKIVYFLRKDHTY